MIRIVIAEDQKLLRGALSSLLSLEEDMEVVAEAEDGHAAWEEIRRLAPDLCLRTPSMGVISTVKVRNGGWRAPTISQRQGCRPRGRI